jgi:phosphate/sulfate permease
VNVDLLLVVITIVVALIFDFLNGFHDAANSIATVVSTRVLSPKLAVVWAAVFNFLAAFFLGSWGQFHWPIILAAHAAIAAGTYFGGWRIVHTMGQRITKLRPLGGFCAESAGAITLFGTALAGIPVSTTHTITGAIVGVGAVHRFSAVRWGVARRIVWAWIVTIPASVLIAGAAYWIIHLFQPQA